MLREILQTRKNRAAHVRRGSHSLRLGRRRICSLETLEGRQLMCADLAVNVPSEPVEGSAEVSVIEGESAAHGGLEGELVQMELAGPVTTVVRKEKTGGFQAEIVEMVLVGDLAGNASVDKVIAEHGKDGPFFPVDSFFDVFVEVELPGISGGDGPMPYSASTFDTELVFLDLKGGASVGPASHAHANASVDPRPITRNLPVPLTGARSGERLRAIEEVFRAVGNFEAEIVSMT